MAINLKNYTTEVAASKSIDLIEKLLGDFGASHIMKEYKEGKCINIGFRIIIDKIPFAFQLPARPSNVESWMKKKKPNGTDKARKEQSERIAWKIQYEYLFIQLTMIELDQLEPMQALLPYLYDVAANESYYDKLKKTKFQNLLPAS